MQVHDVDGVFLDVLLKGHREFGAFGFLDRNEVLDGKGVHDLAAEALGNHAGADALAGGIDGRSGTGRATADDEDVEGALGGDFFGGTSSRASIELGENFLDAHPALAEFCTIQEDGRHGHDLALFNFSLKEGAINHGAAETGVEHGHQVEGLHDIRAVVAGERDEGFGVVGAGQGLDLFDDRSVDLGRMTAGLQQGKDEGGELMAHRNAGKADARGFAGQADGEGGAQRGAEVFTKADPVGLIDDVHEQSAHVFGFGAVVEAGNDFDGTLQLLEIGFELGFDGGVEHGVLPVCGFQGKSAVNPKFPLKSALAWRGRCLMA